MTYLFFDLILVVILAAFCLRGAQRGLVLSLCGLVAVFVALIGAQVASDVLAPKVADVLEPGFSAAIEEQLSTSLDSMYRCFFVDTTVYLNKIFIVLLFLAILQPGYLFKTISHEFLPAKTRLNTHN